MKLLHVFTLCLLVSVSYAEEKTTEKGIWPPWTHRTTTSKTTTTTPSPTTSATTPAPTTTTEIPTTSTSTTPTPTTPTTTTPTPTTPIPTSPTPTTPNPTTPTTAAPPSSTTAVPPPKEWVVRDPATNHVCIIANMDVTFNLHSNNTSKQINISPSNAKAEGGICGNSSQTLEVVWLFESVNSKMLVTFTEKDKHYFISGLELTLAYNLSDVIKVSSFSSSNLTLFQTSVNTSYSCASTDFPEQKNDLKEHVDIKVTELHIEAFRTSNSTSFSSSHFCDGEVPDVVPLVVGICLAVLVLVVVVAYLIGRRRSQASGYLSM